MPQRSASIDDYQTSYLAWLVSPITPTEGVTVMTQRIAFLCILSAAVSITGCFKNSGSKTGGGDVSSTAFELGDLVEHFEPPTLEELNATVEKNGGWQDGPVLDPLSLMRERQANEPQLATVEEALALRNDSDEANDKIRSALGRLPKDDTVVNWDATVTRQTPQSLNHSNPLLVSSVTEGEVYELTAFGLFTFDWNFTPFAFADTVASWQKSADGLYDKVVIRDDLVWSDGEPITAHDVEFSYKVIMTEAVPVRAVRSGTDKLKYVKAYDDHTLVFFHKEALATNIWNVNFPSIPKHKYEHTIPDDPTLDDSEEHVELEENPVTGGPYVIKSRSLTEIVLERREAYYMYEGKQVRDKPTVKTVRLKITPEMSVALLGLKAGDIDEMMLNPTQWTAQTSDDEFYANNTKARGLEWTSFSFFWNNKTPLFSDSRVRWAMSYAFDHAEMLTTLRKGLDKPATGTFHHTARWHPGEGNAIGTVPQPLKMDRDKAKQLLADAGWADSDGDGFLDKEIDGKRRKFEFTMLTRNQQERIDICELMSQNLRLVGIDCNVRSLEAATLQDKMFNREFEAAYGGWGTGADPDTSDNIWGSDQDRNYVGIANPMVDEMFGEGRKIQNDRQAWKDLQVWQDEETREYLKLDAGLADQQPSREDCYATIHALLWRDQPYTWLFYRNAYHGFNKKLRGYNFSPRGPFGYSPGFAAVWVPNSL